MAAPNQVSTVTIPANGMDTVNVYNQDDELRSTASINIAFLPTGMVGNPTTMTPTTVPAVTSDSAGFHFAPNGAPDGSSGTLYITYTPANITLQIPYVVGNPTTSLQVGETEP
jgi:hypothetical protein